jgi:hypothetical protein
VTAEGLRLAYQKVSRQVLKQLAPERGAASARAIKINVGPIKRVLAEALVQSGADRAAWAEAGAFAAAGLIKDLIARELDRMQPPAGADHAALTAGVKDIFRRLAGRAETIARQVCGAVGPDRAGRGETT